VRTRESYPDGLPDARPLSSKAAHVVISSSSGTMVSDASWLAGSNSSRVTAPNPLAASDAVSSLASHHAPAHVMDARRSRCSCIANSATCAARAKVFLGSPRRVRWLGALPLATRAARAKVSRVTAPNPLAASDAVSSLASHHTPAHVMDARRSRCSCIANSATCAARAKVFLGSPRRVRWLGALPFSNACGERQSFWPMKIGRRIPVRAGEVMGSRPGGRGHGITSGAARSPSSD
jgi:hypothetical protein